NGRIGLSIRQVYGPPQRSGGRPPRGRNVSFEEKLARFLKESEQRQQDLKRSVESKRGGRGSRRS
ncbi:MAG TPA: RNA-binding protein S1, partial [Limnochordales bacterium]